MSQKVVIYPLLAQLFVCVALFALPETSTVDEDGGEMTGATMINSSNSTHDDGAPSVQTAPHNDTRGPHGVHGDNHPAPEKEEPDYRNPFTYLPKPFVFAMIFIGAFLLMIFVLGVVTVTRSYVCPRYGRFVDSHPRLKEVMPKWHLTRMGAPSRKSRRRQSATESHLELPKQDSLDNIITDVEISGGVGEMDNESFLASLENVNFSVTPPSTRRNNYSSSSLVRSPLQPHFEAPHPAPFALPPVHYPLSDPGGGLDNTNRLAEVGVPSQNRRYMHSPGNQNNNSVHPFNVNSVANVEPNHDHDNGSLFL